MLNLLFESSHTFGLGQQILETVGLPTTLYDNENI